MAINKKELVKKAIELMKGNTRKASDTGGTGGPNGFYGSYDTKGALQSNQHPCHAFMRYYKNSSVVFSKYLVAPCAEGAEENYLRWLLTGPWSGLADRIKYSPSAHGFYNPCPETTEANFQHNFWVASRSIAEWGHDIAQWNYLVTKEGIDPDVAYWMLYTFNNVSSPASNYSARFPLPKETVYLRKGSPKYDWPLDVQWYGDDAFKRFVKHKPTNFIHMFSPDPSYRPVNEIWGKKQSGDNLYITQLEARYKDKYGKVQPANGANTITYGLTATEIKAMQTDWALTYKEMLEVIRAEEKRIRKAS